MRLLVFLLIIVIVVVAVYVVANYGRSRDDLAIDDYDAAIDVLGRCRAVQANLSYVESLPDRSSPLRDPIEQLVAELRQRANSVERAADELVRLQISGALREREEARLVATLRSTEQATNELHELAVRATDDRVGTQHGAGDKIRALHAALDELYAVDEKDDDAGGDSG